MLNVVVLVAATLDLGLLNSSVDLGLTENAETSESFGLIIVSILNLLRQNSTWGQIEEDFNCRMPIIHFQDVQLGVKLSVVVDNENSFKTSVLLRQYQLIDDRFAVLTVAFRTWARICYLDQPDLGTLPSHAYSLMVLYFLQQHRVLPVLHKAYPDDVKDESNDESFLSTCSLSFHWFSLAAGARGLCSFMSIIC